MPVDLVPPVQRWSCADCSAHIETWRTGALTPMHPCRGHGGFKIPMVPYGSSDRVTLIEREDYVGTEDVRTDAKGTPYMRAEVERRDGHRDAWVYAPTANVRMVSA